MQDLLNRLEDVSAQAVERSDPGLQDEDNAVPVRDLIQQREKLIGQLQPLLDANTPVSYQEWNRIVAIHHQGARIQNNLRQIRDRLALEMSASCTGHAFLERITGMLVPAR